MSVRPQPMTQWIIPKRMLATRHLLVVAASALLLGAAGCGQPKPGGIMAPEKPLSPAEEQFLEQMEAVPEKDRTAFANKHRTEIMSFATSNRAFGERLNELMGVKPQGGSR